MVKNDPLKSLSFPQSASGVAKNCLFYRMNARLISHAESVSDRLKPCFTPLSVSLVELLLNYSIGYIGDYMTYLMPR